MFNGVINTHKTTTIKVKTTMDNKEPNEARSLSDLLDMFKKAQGKAANVQLHISRIILEQSKDVPEDKLSDDEFTAIMDQPEVIAAAYIAVALKITHESPKQTRQRLTAALTPVYAAIPADKLAIVAARMMAHVAIDRVCNSPLSGANAPDGTAADQTGESQDS